MVRRAHTHTQTNTTYAFKVSPCGPEVKINTTSTYAECTNDITAASSPERSNAQVLCCTTVALRRLLYFADLCASMLAARRLALNTPAGMRPHNELALSFAEAAAVTLPAARASQGGAWRNARMSSARLGRKPFPVTADDTMSSEAPSPRMMSNTSAHARPKYTLREERAYMHMTESRCVPTSAHMKPKPVVLQSA